MNQISSATSLDPGGYLVAVDLIIGEGSPELCRANEMRKQNRVFFGGCENSLSLLRAYRNICAFFALVCLPLTKVKEEGGRLYEEV